MSRAGLNDTITLKIPSDIAEMLITYSIDDTRAVLLRGESIELLRLLTFGYLNTGILNNKTGDIIAYVTQWQDNLVTICELAGDNCHMVHSFITDHTLDSDDASAAYTEFYNKNRAEEEAANPVVH